MLALFFSAASVVVAAVFQESDREDGTPSDAYGFDSSGRRGLSLWSGPRFPEGWSLEEEAAEGHMFASPAPPG